MKKFAAGTLTALFTLSPMAQADDDSRFFLGFALGSGSAAYEVEAERRNRASGQLIARATEKDSESAGVFRLLAGSDRTNSRTYLFLYGQSYDDATFSVFGVSHDWKFAEGEQFRPYFGLTLGAASMEWEENQNVPGVATLPLKGEKARSFAVGAQIGLLLQASDNLDLDIGANLLATNMETEITLVGTTDNIVIKHTTQRLTSFSVGFNYRF